MGFTVLVAEKTSIYRGIELIEGNLLRFVGARAHWRALMTQKSCAVGMHDAKLGNHFNFSLIGKRNAYANKPKLSTEILSYFQTQ